MYDLRKDWHDWTPVTQLLSFFRLTIKSRFMVLFWNIMSWFRYKEEVFTPEVLYYVKNYTEKTWLLCFERYCYFCYHATLVDVKRKRTRKGEMKLAMSSICNTQKYWIVADGKVFLLCNNRFLSLFIQNDHRLSICKFSITNIIQNPIDFNCIEHIDHNDHRCLD